MWHIHWETEELFYVVTHLRKYSELLPLLLERNSLIKGQVQEEVTLFIHTKVGQHRFVLCFARALELWTEAEGWTRGGKKRYLIPNPLLCHLLWSAVTYWIDRTESSCRLRLSFSIPSLPASEPITCVGEKKRLTKRNKIHKSRH